MPNWCDNSVTIYHKDKSKIDAIEAGLASPDEQQLFNTILPNPSGEWDYEWSVNNWGSKWDASIIDWERQDDNTIWVSFESAWSPPSTLYGFMHDEAGYDVRAFYYEPGMGFCGMFLDGYDDYYEYDISDRTSLENLPDEILDFTDLLNRHDDWVAEEEMEREQAEYEATVTEWYPVDQNPHYVGFYETKEEGNWPFYKFAHWNGKKWTVDGKKPTFKIAGWRGLKEDPAILTEENADDVLENMMKDMGFERA